MIVSEAGIERLKQREGVVLTMYRDSAGLPTIGVGHLLTRDELSSGKLRIWGTDVKWVDGISEDDATQLLRQDLDVAQLAVDHGVTTVDVAQHQFDALVSLVFNIGATAFKNSTLLKRLKSGDRDAVPEQLRK